jgi:vacuolar-type H+-ATPase subunit F/Vma7
MMRRFYSNFDVYFSYFFNNNGRFKHELSAAAIVKNEAPYIREWIEYHKLVGVEKFYIYNNESEDNIKEVLQPYIDSAEVEYIDFPGKAVQCKAYSDAIRRFRNETKWMAIIDIDEFIVPVTAEKITDVINEIKPDAALAINLVAYGYNRHYDKPDGLVIKNYTKNGGIACPVKCIVNPRTVFGFVSPHYARHILHREGINENHKKIPLLWGFENPEDASIQKIRVNHYFTKSYAEYKLKIARGRAFKGDKLELREYEPDCASHNYDPIMDKYIPILEEKLAQETSI